MPFSTAEKLRIQFRKSLNKKHVKNAEMDPNLTEALRRSAESDESFMVRVDPTNGEHYWFSDRRLLHEDESGLRELFRYQDVIKAHWIEKDLQIARKAKEWPKLKRECYDRLEIETRGSVIVLDKLGQAYWPTLHFLWWIIREGGRVPNNTGRNHWQT